MSDGLKLRAEDAEDLAVVAACLQDSILPIGEMAWLASERRFAMVLNRFRWEIGPEGEAKLEAASSAPTEPGELEPGEGSPVYERVHCAVRVDGVEGVRSRGIDLKDRSRILELLTLEATPDGVALHFAGGGCVELRAAKWLAFVEDIGEPWPTRCCPRHRIDDSIDDSAP